MTTTTSKNIKKQLQQQNLDNERFLLSNIDIPVYKYWVFEKIIFCRPAIKNLNLKILDSLYFNLNWVVL